MTRLTLEKQEQYLAQFKEAGMTIVEDVDLAAFQKQTESVYSAFPNWTPGLHEQIQAIIAK